MLVFKSFISHGLKAFGILFNAYNDILILNGHVQEWTNLTRIGDPETRLHPVAPQASAVHSRAASFQT